MENGLIGTTLWSVGPWGNASQGKTNWALKLSSPPEGPGLKY